MAPDSIPIPPSPIDSSKEKKGFLGLFGKKKNASSLDKDLDKVKNEEKGDIQKMVSYEKDAPKIEKDVSKDISNSFKQAAKKEIDLPEPETNDNSDKELDMNDLENLEKELDENPQNTKKTKDALEPPKLEKEEFDLPDFEETIEKPVQQNTMELELPEAPVEIKKEPEVEEILEKEEEKEKHKKETKEKAKEVKEAKTEAKKEIEVTPVSPELTTTQAQQIVDAQKIEPAKIRPRKGVEQYFKGLDQDHKKITESITKAIKSPEQEIPPEHFFILRNGRPVKNLQELIKALRTIDDETFKHHVNDTRNDFANWLRDILKKEDLADQIRSKKAKEELLKILTNHVREIDESLLAHKKEQLSLIERVRKARDELYKLQSELDAREKNIAKRESQGRQIDRERTAIEDGKKALAQQQSNFVEERRRTLAKEKQYTLELKKFQEQQSRLKAAETKFNSQLQDLQKRENAVKSKESTFSKKEKELSDRENEVNKKQAKIESVLQADENLKKILEGMDAKIQEEKDRIEKGGFSAYVKEELAKMYPEHVTQISNMGGQLDVPPPKQADLYAQIKECRTLLEQNQLREAQKRYNQLKQDFSQRKLPPLEKEQIYNKIIELYDDIHLALMQ